VVGEWSVRNEMKVIMPLMFFVSDVEDKEPEVHNLSVYIGEQPPDVPEGVTLRTFKGKRNLSSFLMAGEWDRATIYKSPECPQEVVDDLTDWMNLHMSLGKVVILNGNKSEKSE
jgi:hypothetical protein